MLGDLNFLHHLPQRGAVTRPILPNDPHLLGALGLSTVTQKTAPVSSKRAARTQLQLNAGKLRSQRLKYSTHETHFHCVYVMTPYI